MCCSYTSIYVHTETLAPGENTLPIMASCLPEKQGWSHRHKALGLIPALRTPCLSDMNTHGRPRTSVQTLGRRDSGSEEKGDMARRSGWALMGQVSCASARLWDEWQGCVPSVYSQCQFCVAGKAPTEWAWHCGRALTRGLRPLATRPVFSDSE